MTDQMILGVDAGGTFTDFVLLITLDGKTTLKIHKVLSTPSAPEAAILRGIRELGLEKYLINGSARIIHGSTVATNAALEGKGARTVLVCNHGFADLLTLGRQARPALYQLEFAPRKPPVPADHCIETGGRLAADGTILEPLLDSELQQLCDRIVALKPEAVAINLLFSFRDDSFERQIEQKINNLDPSLSVSRSSAVLPEYREYERGIATWLNASLSPIVSGYLSSLQTQLASCPLLIMQSSGETIAANTAANRAVNLLLSGPAAGLAAIRYLGEQSRETRFISFDMGGTSTDVALIDGELTITNEGQIAGYPVAVPMVDMHTIGAGGGSIAIMDAGGMLQVGPQSAGADPGPVCYGLGGTSITVTDANVVLGRISSDTALAGDFQLDREAAAQAMTPLAKSAGLTVPELAKGIIAVANEHMTSALRMISVQRGYDPARFTLASFGGAGGLHVCALADAMGMRQAVVPAHAGVLSALGMLVAPRGRQYSRTVQWELSDTADPGIDEVLQELKELGTIELTGEGLCAHQLRYEASADLCYQGQSSSLNVPWGDAGSAAVSFHELHQQRYGFALKQCIEIINVRLRIVCDISVPDIPPAPPVATCNNIQYSRVYGYAEEVIVYERETLDIGVSLPGPAIIKELSATTFIDTGWAGKTDSLGNLWLSRTA